MVSKNLSKILSSKKYEHVVSKDRRYATPDWLSQSEEGIKMLSLSVMLSDFLYF
ncbi:hypothetical protein IQ283_12120 [Alkalihalobacillus hwajinpoensis]|nr:hypothetical protein [Pseudalkalibacillus hwajinpoensis]